MARAKRVDRKLHVVIDYTPNCCIGEVTDLELNVKVNDDLAGGHELFYFCMNRKNLTLNDILRHTKIAIEKELDEENNARRKNYD